MLLALFLHLYQPPTQFAKVLKSITDASYRRLLSIIQGHPSAKLTLNVCGSLTEQLAASGSKRIIEDTKELVGRGQIELTGSVAYHPLLTEIPSSEIRRQILLNNEINRRYFGGVYRPRGFFPPEMAINRQVLDVVSELGFAWVIVDESAIKNQRAKNKKQKSFINKGLRIFVRDSKLSIKVAFSQIRTVEELKKEILAEKLSAESCVLLAMDGETFGHHRPEQLGFFEELLASTDFQMVTVLELQEVLPKPSEVKIKTSSWGPWERWKNPKNPIHKLQWELTDLAIKEVQSSKFKVQNFSINNSTIQQLTSDQKQWLKARQMLDKSLHSDQFWWASGTPHWHYQMVERGARMLKNVVLAVPDALESDKRRVGKLYDKIIKTGLELYGKRVIE